MSVLIPQLNARGHWITCARLPKLTKTLFTFLFASAADVISVTWLALTGSFLLNSCNPSFDVSKLVFFVLCFYKMVLPVIKQLDNKRAAVNPEMRKRILSCMI